MLYLIIFILFLMPGGAPLRVVDLIRLKEADVEKLFEPRIFERGRQYYEQGRVERPVVYRKSIMAECSGTQPENYGIRIEVDEGRIIASCTSFRSAGLTLYSIIFILLFMPGGAPLRVVDLIRLKEADVEKLFEPRIFERGIQYYEQGRVERPVVYRKSIMAECRGTQPENYGIRIEVDDGRIVASCTCPYASGNCKHIAAVLYAWLKKPSMFTDLGQAEQLLTRQEKSALVEMVIDMARYDPGVIYVINLRLLPAEDLPGFVQREMGVIFSGEPVDYLNVREIVRKLDIFREYAADLLGKKKGRHGHEDHCSSHRSHHWIIIRAWTIRTASCTTSLSRS